MESMKKKSRKKQQKLQKQRFDLPSSEIKYVEYWLIDSYENSENSTGANSNIISEAGRQMEEF